MPNKEPILKDNKDRFVIFPVKHNDIWDWFKQAQATFWTAEEIDFHQDVQDWNTKLSSREQNYLKQLLAFMAASQDLSRNLTASLNTEIKEPGSGSFFGFQQMMENTYRETFSMLLNIYIPEEAEYEELPEKVTSSKTFIERSNWQAAFETAAFAERLVAMAALKGIFSTGTACVINRLKNRNLLPGLTYAGNLIARDLETHRDFACYLHNNHLTNRVSKARIREILLQAHRIEEQFFTSCLPINMSGLSPAATTQHLEFVTDALLEAFGCEKEFGSESPYAFMNNTPSPQVGILERRAGELKKTTKEQDTNKINQNTGH
ncbi:ribonucleoside-diphosphate reductase [Antarcticibacterium flavum]|uniref:ribonucleoside-diphosphate reductase n=1 Tax=Antarcticibacterium flavum TaxID=2058175 RepID=A0A5B7X2X9_9FLAO|nr:MULTISPECIES: ribonucleotide-diphosphate reductase subunit beta [Antarcticibacterium]MCM4161348.1 ribonucleoside-diphosphate reductase [Antarcticibacterium sp. W02-3]QCY69425.1 ribonucleoside-diphosphate reductase [Antarcticibacterium flavum]